MDNYTIYPRDFQYVRKKNKCRLATRVGIVGVWADLSAAAAENKNEGDNYKPNVSVIKKIAQAVIHSKFSLQSIKSFCALCYNYMKGG